MTAMKRLLSEVTSSVQGTMGKYGETMKNSEEDSVKGFFTLITSFIRSFHQAHAENLAKYVHHRK
jgi:hypothetical protein